MSTPPRVPVFYCPARRDTSWMSKAACAGLDPELFFPSKWRRIDPLVRHVCKHCPVRIDCLTYGIATHADGVWGGIGEHERRRIARRTS